MATESNRTKQLCLGHGGAASGAAGMARAHPTAPPTPRVGLLMKWRGSPPPRGQGEGSGGSPLPWGRLSRGQLQHFLCHRAPVAKVNRSFEIKWKPQEVFFLILKKEINKTVAVLGQAVLFLHAQICTGPREVRASCERRDHG